jgi:hypothetical protein
MVLEGSLRSRDKELERVLKKLEEAELEVAAVEAKQTKAEEAARRTESESIKQIVYEWSGVMYAHSLCRLLLQYVGCSCSMLCTPADLRSFLERT